MSSMSIVSLSACLIGSVSAFGGQAAPASGMAGFGLPPSGMAMSSESMGAFDAQCGSTSEIGGVPLGFSKSFAILAKSGITNAGTSSIQGNMGVSPIDAEAITGFSLVADNSNTFSTSSQVDGRIFASNYLDPTPTDMTSAISAMETAYTDAASRSASDASNVNLGAGLIGGLTLTPGTYKWSVDINFATDIYLKGGPCDVFILETSGDVIVGSGARVTMLDGARAKNVYWQVAGRVDVGTTAHMEGTILCATGVTFKTGSSLTGRILAQTNAVLQATTITGI